MHTLWQKLCRPVYYERMASLHLADGSSLQLRPLEPDDGALLVRLFFRLSPETVYRRFLSPIPDPYRPEMRRLLEVDHRRREALAALSAGEVVAVARYAIPGFAHHLQRLQAGAFGEPVVDLDLQPQLLGQRLQRLRAAGVGAGDEAAHAQRLQLAGYPLRLLSAFLAQRPFAVIAVPVLAVARVRVTDEVDRGHGIQSRSDLAEAVL